MLQNLLTVAKIKFETHRMYIKQGLTIHGQPDIFIKPNICIFADGNYWHANPKFYKPNSIIIGKKKAKDKWNSDNEKRDKLKKQLNVIMANCTGKSEKQLTQDSDRDFFMNPTEAKKYGIIDTILTKRK